MLLIFKISNVYFTNMSTSILHDSLFKIQYQTLNTVFMYSEVISLTLVLICHDALWRKVICKQRYPFRSALYSTWFFATDWNLSPQVGGKTFFDANKCVYTVRTILRAMHQSEDQSSWAGPKVLWFTTIGRRRYTPLFPPFKK